MSIQSLGQNVATQLRLAPAIGNKLLGNASAVELAGIVRLTAKKAGDEWATLASFKTSDNFIRGLNIETGGLGGVLNTEGHFFPQVRKVLNETGYTLKDFVKYMDVTYKLRKSMMNNPKFKSFMRNNKISLEKAKSIIEKGEVPPEIEKIIQESGLTTEVLTDYLTKTINIKDVLLKLVKKTS